MLVFHIRTNEAKHHIQFSAAATLFGACCKKVYVLFCFSIASAWVVVSIVSAYKVILVFGAWLEAPTFLNFQGGSGSRSWRAEKLIEEMKEQTYHDMVCAFGEGNATSEYF